MTQHCVNAARRVTDETRMSICVRACVHGAGTRPALVGSSCTRRQRIGTFRRSPGTEKHRLGASIRWWMQDAGEPSMCPFSPINDLSFSKGSGRLMIPCARTLDRYTAALMIAPPSAWHECWKGVPVSVRNRPVVEQPGSECIVDHLASVCASFRYSLLSFRTGGLSRPIHSRDYMECDAGRVSGLVLTVRGGDLASGGYEKAVASFRAHLYWRSAQLSSAAVFRAGTVPHRLLAGAGLRNRKERGFGSAGAYSTTALS